MQTAIEYARNSYSRNTFGSNVPYAEFEAEAATLAVLYEDYAAKRNRIVEEFKIARTEAKVASGIYAFTSVERELTQQLFENFQEVRGVARTKSRCLEYIRVVRRLNKTLDAAYKAWKAE